MQTRTGLVWMLLGLLSLSPLAAAQAGDDPYPIGIWAECDHLAAAPGASASFSLHIGTHTGPHNVTLSADALPAGLTGAFGSTLVSPAPQAYASTDFVVSVAPDARAREPIAIMLHGVDEAGHSTSLRVYMRIAQPATNTTTTPAPEPTTTARPPPTPAPARAPEPVPAAHPEFRLFATPEVLKLAPGASANALVYVKANTAMRVALHAVASTGYSASFENSMVDITPGEPMRLNVSVTADANASAQGSVEIVGVSGEQKREAALHIELPHTPTANPAFMMHVDPASQTIAAGGEAQFVLYFKASRDITVDLSTGRHNGEGYSARFEPTSFVVAAGGEAKALLTVTANQSADRYGAFQVLAKARNSSEQRDAFVKIAKEQTPTNTSVPTPPPATQPAPHDKPHPGGAPSRAGATMGGGIEIGIEGFDHAGGLSISVRVGDGNVMHVRLGPEVLRGMLRESKTAGNDVGHHSPLWIRLQLEDGPTGAGLSAAGALANA